MREWEGGWVIKAKERRWRYEYILYPAIQMRLFQEIEPKTCIFALKIAWDQAYCLQKEGEKGILFL